MNKLFLIAASAAALAAAGTVSAQQQPAQAPLNHGPAITGVCIYNGPALMQTSTAGQAVNTRLQQLMQQVEAELQPEANAIDTELRTLQSQQASLPADQFNQRRQALGQRAQTFETLRQTRLAELQYTEQSQRLRIAQTVNPILTQVYQARGCSLLLDASGILAANPAMDVTPQVIQQLNTTLPTVTFDRMPLPQQQQPAQS
ncbi:OmpH family outer membrane protein [Brevundimonas sp. 2R-24]|uniref:OmpH family outer membrane protein n=1 Tax=Peiella sedimenti TaxID=3061083 RepID=A0ABT8SPB4_9CAUL|nr:OmpH family outer membrane protein [Caulobacteraceae bacterium XZ-24]